MILVVEFRRVHYITFLTLLVLLNLESDIFSLNCSFLLSVDIANPPLVNHVNLCTYSVYLYINFITAVKSVKFSMDLEQVMQ